MKKTKTRDIQCEPMFRELAIRNIDTDARTIDLSFSSEHPVERWWGTEILDHAPESVRLDRIKETGPVLVGHNPNDHVGVVEDISIDEDRKGRSVVRFGRSERASEIFEDIKDGIRKNISVGYMLHKAVLEESGDDGEVYRVTDWEPFEVSIVSVPADPSVGVGRSAEMEKRTLTIVETRKEKPAMDPKDKKKDDNDKLSDDEIRSLESDAGEKAAKRERERVDAILAVADKHNAGELGREHINSGSTPEEFFRALLESDALDSRAIQVDSNADLGLTEDEVRQFSFLKAIRAQMKNASQRDIDAAGFEMECSRAAEQLYKKDAQGVLIPDEIIRARVFDRDALMQIGERGLAVAVGNGQLPSQRDLNVGTTTAGGHTVQTDLDAANFIDLLRNRICVEKRGARVMTGLQGNLAIPRQTGGASAYWVGEGGAPTESQAAFDQVALTPHTVGAFTDFTRKLVLQSSIDVENFVRGDLAKVIGTEVDRVAIEGAPDASATADEPRGILKTSGIGSVSLGAHGGVPTRAGIINLMREVMIDSADMGSLGWLMNAQVWAKLANTKTDTGSGQFIINPDNPVRNLYGFGYDISQNVPADLTDGSGTALSALIYGNFDDAMFGYWSGVDLLVDPYTASTTGTVRVVALLDVDFAVRHAQSFAAIQDMVTT